jgi:ubiquinone/menaquinone biosynthesis C-methylase UbiE
MENTDRKNHWENIYQTKQLTEVSWFQPTPETSLNFFKELNIAKTAKIIDMGGGDSFLADHLLELGYSDITVLDISEKALERAQKRLGEKAGLIKWIVADAAHFQPTEQYDFWHDRAAFHFLTAQTDIDNYISTVQKSISPNGYLVMGTFSENGPKKCSGIEIKQYSEKSMSALFTEGFELINSFTTDHNTPFNTVQNFIFCCFKKRI